MLLISGIRDEEKKIIYKFVSLSDYVKETEGVPEKDGTVWPGLGAERGQQGAGGLLLHAAR